MILSRLVWYVLAQTILQYCIYGNTKEQYKVLLVHGASNKMLYFVNDANIDFAIFRATCEICGFQSKCSFI
jgi:hypothetical protein